MQTSDLISLQYEQLQKFQQQQFEQLQQFQRQQWELGLKPSPPATKPVEVQPQSVRYIRAPARATPSNATSAPHPFMQLFDRALEKENSPVNTVRSPSPAMAPRSECGQNTQPQSQQCKIPAELLQALLSSLGQPKPAEAPQVQSRSTPVVESKPKPTEVKPSVPASQPTPSQPRASNQENRVPELVQNLLSQIFQGAVARSTEKAAQSNVAQNKAAGANPVNKVPSAESKPIKIEVPAAKVQPPAVATKPAVKTDKPEEGNGNVANTGVQRLNELFEQYQQLSDEAAHKKIDANSIRIG
jgi:hypothetical protein